MAESGLEGLKVHRVRKKNIDIGTLHNIEKQ